MGKSFSLFFFFSFTCSLFPYLSTVDILSLSQGWGRNMHLKYSTYNCTPAKIVSDWVLDRYNPEITLTSFFKKKITRFQVFSICLQQYSFSLRYPNSFSITCKDINTKIPVQLWLMEAFSRIWLLRWTVAFHATDSFPNLVFPCQLPVTVPSVALCSNPASYAACTAISFVPSAGLPSPFWVLGSTPHLANSC